MKYQLNFKACEDICMPVNNGNGNSKYPELFNKE